jgi:hypothetical protein
MWYAICGLRSLNESQSRLVLVVISRFVLALVISVPSTARGEGRHLKAHPTCLIVSEHRLCTYLLRKFRDQSALTSD